jgi:hypothetical protein
MIKKFIKLGLPLNLSINLYLIINHKIDKILIESYKLTKKQKENIIKIFKNTKKENKLYFSLFNPINHISHKSLTNNITKSFLHGTSLNISTNNKNINNKNIFNKNNDFIYLLKFKIVNCNDEEICVLKKKLTNKITNKIVDELNLYQDAITKIDENIKIELTIEFMEKKILKNKYFNIIEIL